MKYTRRWIIPTLIIFLFALSIQAVEVDVESGVIRGTCVYVHETFGSAQTDISQADFAMLAIEPGDVLEITIAGISLAVPYVYLPGEVPLGTPRAFHYGEYDLEIGLEYGNFVRTYDVHVGMPVEVSLLEAGGYAIQLAVQHIERPTDRASYETDDAFANFRMIACGSIASGRLYRSSHPASDDPRSQYVAALMERACIRTVLNVGESATGLEAAYVYNPMYRELGEDGMILALNLGLIVDSPVFRHGLKQAIEFIAAGEPPFLIHCWEGKDRTGVLAAVLEALLGASLHDIVADYMTTYSNYYGITVEHDLYDSTCSLILAKLEEMGHGEALTPDNVNSIVERYIREHVGISEDVLSMLRAVLQ